MTDRAAFLAAIAAAPADDVPRLVFADWLAEHGEPERAEFIRVQCELAQIIAAPAFRKLADTLRRQLGRTTDAVISRGIESRDDVAALRRRERELSSCPLAMWAEWCRPLTTLGPDVTWTMARGFVAEVTCPADDWCRAAAAILAENPPPHVTLTAAPTPTGTVLVYYAEARWAIVGHPSHAETVVRANAAGCPGWLALFRLTWPGVTFDPPSRGPAAVTGPRLTAR